MWFGYLEKTDKAYIGKIYSGSTLAENHEQQYFISLFGPMHLTIPKGKTFVFG